MLSTLTVLSGVAVAGMGVGGGMTTVAFVPSGRVTGIVAISSGGLG